MLVNYFHQNKPIAYLSQTKYLVKGFNDDAVVKEGQKVVYVDDALAKIKTS